MKRLALILSLLLALSACAPAPTPVPTFASLTPTPPLPTATLAPTATSTSTPTPVPCDPMAADYCLQEGHFLLQPPVVGGTVDDTYLYGTTQSGMRDPHHGVEYPAVSGAPVLAAADGLVVFAGEGGINQRYGPPAWADRSFYGNFILLQHELTGVAGPFYTLYAHLSAVDVLPGQMVAAGEPIGAVGATGSALGAHLHFEVRQGGDTYADNRNPLLWLRPPEGQAVLAVRAQSAGGETLFVDGDLQLLEPGADGVCRLGLPRVSDGTAYDLPAYDRRNDGRFPVGLDPLWRETFARAVPEGCYRLIYAGGTLERVVRLEAGRLTLVVFKVE